MDAEGFFGIQVALQLDLNHQNHGPRTPKVRVDPRDTMSSSEFKRHFRFTKETFAKIVQMLEPDLLLDPRGDPLSPVQQVCVALHTYGGGHYQRVSGLCGGVSQNAAREALIRVTDAIIERKDQFIFMPDVQEMEDTSERMFDKFGLPRFAMAVDGMMSRFEEAPKKLPPGTYQQLYWCRKQFYAINCQVVANDRRIYDLDCRWPGSTHDSRIWNRSEVKHYMESQRRFLVAGDSGYPISDVLIKPFSMNEASGDRRKRMFNRRLSGARTVMSENIYGVWKRRFPIIKSLRTGFLFSQKIICATAILFNLGRMWAEEDLEEEENEDADGNDDDNQEFTVQDQTSNARARGQVERQILLDNMP